MDSRQQPTGMMMARPKEERALDLFRRLAVKWKRRKIHRHVTKVSPVANSRPTLKGDFRPGWNSAALPWWSPCILLLLLCTARASACEGNICRSIWMRASSHSPSTALLGPKHYLPKSRTVYLKTSSQLRPAPSLSLRQVVHQRVKVPGAATIHCSDKQQKSRLLPPSRLPCAAIWLNLNLESLPLFRIVRLIFLPLAEFSSGGCWRARARWWRARGCG